MDTMQQPGQWSFFDKVYCITLADRPDRREKAQAQFRRVGLAERVEFVVACRHPVDSEQGIFDSHLRCMEKGLDAGAGTIAIFEDDVVFDRFHPAVLQQCVDFLATAPGWDLFFFGCLVRGSRTTPTPAVLQVAYRCLAHAYAVNRGFAATLSRKPWQRVPFDVMLRRLGRGTYAAYPAFAFQGDSSSDNTRLRGLDRFRRLCGGLQRIQKINEWYHRHKPLVVALHLFLALLLALLWFR